MLSVSPEVQSVIERMASLEFTSIQGSIHMRGNAPVAAESEQSSSDETMITTIDFVLARPNRLRIEVHSPTERADGLLISDGERLHCQSGLVGRTVSAEAPDSFSHISQDILSVAGSGSMILPTLMGIRDPLRAEFHRSVPTVEEVTSATIDGVECTTVVTRTSRSGGGVSTRRYSVDELGILRDFTAQVDHPDWSQGMRMTETLTSVEVNGSLPPDAFTYVPRSGAF